MTLPRPKIVVLGSLNIDETFQLERLPKSGETVLARTHTVARGGKGANQAIAAARAGGEVTLIGCVGDDVGGASYREALAHEGVATDLIRTVTSARTGTAVIALDEKGENTILVSSGANACVSPADVARAADRIRSADLLLLQLEVPLPAVREAAKIAREAGVKVILNPSPWRAELLNDPIVVDLLLVNEWEGHLLTGRRHEQLVTDRDQFMSRVTANVLVVTLGNDGSLALHRDGQLHCTQAFHVTVVDTVGAGDAFAGALAVAWAEKMTLPDALEFASAAGALATTKLGAQAATPTRADILELMAS
jgi:ribokinase